MKISWTHSSTQYTARSLSLLLYLNLCFFLIFKLILSCTISLLSAPPSPQSMLSLDIFPFFSLHNFFCYLAKLFNGNCFLLISFSECEGSRNLNFISFHFFSTRNYTKNVIFILCIYPHTFFFVWHLRSNLDPLL